MTPEANTNRPALQAAEALTYTRGTPSAPALSRLWRIAGILMAALCIGLPLGYKLVLYLHGYTTIDLWSGGTIRPIPAGGARFVQPGHLVATTGELLALTGALMGATLLWLGRSGRRSRCRLLGTAILACAVIGGLQSLQIGFHLAGI